MQLDNARLEARLENLPEDQRICYEQDKQCLLQAHMDEVTGVHADFSQERRENVFRDVPMPGMMVRETLQDADVLHIVPNMEPRIFQLHQPQHIPFM